MLDDRQRAEKLRKELRAQRVEADWDWLTPLNGERSDKKSASKFMLGAIIDYQILAKQAWANAKRLAETEFGDPVDLWETITSIPESEWEARFKRYKLHRFRSAHNRVWRIGREIVQRYGGDARRIWECQSASEVLERLNNMRVGPQISRMIVGALYDTGQIKDLGDLKADLHVRHVLGRVFTGSKVSASEAHRLAKMVAQGPTWPLDSRLYFIGKDYCGKDPNCEHCDRRLLCTRGSWVQGRIGRLR